MPQPVEVEVTVKLWLEGDWTNLKPPHQSIVDKEIHDYLRDMVIKDHGSAPLTIGGREIIAIETRKQVEEPDGA